MNNHTNFHIIKITNVHSKNAYFIHVLCVFVFLMHEHNQYYAEHVKLYKNCGAPPIELHFHYIYYKTVVFVAPLFMLHTQHWFYDGAFDFFWRGLFNQINQLNFDKKENKFFDDEKWWTQLRIFETNCVACLLFNFQTHPCVYCVHPKCYDILAMGTVWNTRTPHFIVWYDQFDISHTHNRHNNE